MSTKARPRFVARVTLPCPNLTQTVRETQRPKARLAALLLRKPQLFLKRTRLALMARSSSLRKTLIIHLSSNSMLKNSRKEKSLRSTGKKLRRQYVRNSPP